MRLGTRVVLSSRRLLAGVSLGVAGVLVPLLSGGAGMTAVHASVVPASAGGSLATSGGAASSGGTASAGPAVVTQAPHIPVGAVATGAPALSAPETGAVSLQPRDPAALAKFISEVTNKHSSLFHHYLPAGAFGSVFGPTAATISAVKDFLAASDLQVTGVAKDGMLIDFAGTAGSVEHAFDTGLATYKLANGSQGLATTSAIRLPSSVAGSVAAVIGLDNLVHPQPAGLVRQPATNAGTQPQVKTATFNHPSGSPNACPSAQQAATEFGGLTDDQIANAYGAFGLYGSGDFGQGQTIAVYELEPFQRSDINTFDTCYFGATAANLMNSRLNVVPVDGGQPAGPGSGEAILDVQDVSAIAPQANINVYEAPNTSFGGIDEYSAIVNQDTAQVVTSSWGLCEQAVQLGEPGIQQTENFLFQQAAAQGQSIFAAAGDTGSDDCNAFRYPYPVNGQNPLSVDDPASQPYVVSVGGTTIYDAATQPAGEKVWNDGANWGAGGGGISMSWPMPSWQQSALVPGMVMPGSPDYTNANLVESQAGYSPGFCGNNSTFIGFPCRTVPDVSAQANEFTGAVTIYSSEFVSPSTPTGWITIGGTSSATPIWASSLALVNASKTSAACTPGTGPGTGPGVGFVSPLLYGVASNPTAYAASFNDITVGNNDIYGLDNGLVFPATAGYDLASGLGSPMLTAPGGADGLAYYLCNFQPPAGSAPTVTSLSPAFVSIHGNVEVTVTGSGFESGGTPDVASVGIAGITTPNTGYFTVLSATQLMVDVPPSPYIVPSGSPQDGSGPADITVTLTNGMTSSPGPGSILQYVDETITGATLPSVTGVSPYGGLQAAGNTVTIFGSGFTGATGVTFGGVAATSFTVKSSYEITATVPAYASGTTSCASAPAINPATDICQVQVVVTNANGSSATDTILPPYEGSIAFNTMGVVSPTPGTEVMPAPTEYDYVPVPTITSVSTGALPPLSYANELGGTLVLITGTGFNPLTLSWVDIGNPAVASSQDFTISYETGTEIELLAPAIAASPAQATIQPVSLPVSVTSIAGSSTGSAVVTYAGIPQVTGVVNDSNATTVGGMYGAPDTGGTPITLSGSGFNQAIGPIEFSDYDTPYSIGTQYTYTVASDTSISTQTVAQNPAIADVEVCSVTGCSLNPPADFLALYPIGNPVVDSISPNSGSPAGGTPVTISGENLGCITGVFFGATPAASYTNLQAILDCGQTYQAQVTSPAGSAGSTVPVTVTTLESLYTGYGASAASPGSEFTYAASSYQALPPTRILDTRISHQTLGATGMLNLTVTGGEVPADATAVALNVTATNTTAPSYLSVYPAGSPIPTVSNLNWSTGQTVANLVIVPVGANGQVTLYNSQGSTDVVVDLEGYFAPQASGSIVGGYVPLTPARITDTRSGSGQPNAGHTLSAGSVLNVTVAGVGGVPAGGVMAAVLNVTATNTTQASYLTVYPQGSSRPTASNLNWVAGQTRANRVIVPVNPATGEVSIYNANGSADVVVDVDGYFTANNTPVTGETLYTPVTPTRAVDTRVTGTPLGAGQIFVANMAGQNGVGVNATAVVTNVTAVNTTAASYFTVYPGPSLPLASDVNWSAGQVVPNLTIATLNGSGSFNVYNANGSADLLIDVFGYFSPIA
jgi:hypothetical protein